MYSGYADQTSALASAGAGILRIDNSYFILCPFCPYLKWLCFFQCLCKTMGRRVHLCINIYSVHYMMQCCSLFIQVAFVLTICLSGALLTTAQAHSSTIPFRTRWWRSLLWTPSGISRISFTRAPYVIPALKLLMFVLSGMVFTSGILLFYTAMVVPVQIFMWDYSDFCNKFPTLYFDVVVDLFFMVESLWARASNVISSQQA